MKTVIELAREAGFSTAHTLGWPECYARFAELVRADERDRAIRENAYVAAEREACAKVCDRVVEGKDPDDIHSDSQWAALSLAAEIRARGNNT